MDLASLLPITKFDIIKASNLVRLGFPAVAPVMPQILEWVQDRNWPVSGVFEPFLASLGVPLAPHVRAILAGDDEGWKYSILAGVVMQSPELAVELGPELKRIANTPSDRESAEEIDQVAREVLNATRGRAPGA